MNDGWSQGQYLADIIEQAFAITVDANLCANKLRDIPAPSNVDPIQLVQSVLHNPAQLSDYAIANVVAEHLTLFTTAPEAEFDLPVTVNGSFAERWQAYINKLEALLLQVQERVVAQYELNLLMPPQRQLLALQEECFQLTTEYYGKGNICCFYLYFIRMCEAANITRFVYHKIDKYHTPDKYVSLINFVQRTAAMQEYDQKIYQSFIKQGGSWARGRSEIDATSISNVFYYKNARQLMYLHSAKQLILDHFKKNDTPLLSYGSLPQEQREKFWQLIQKNFPADTATDLDNLFYKFAVFCNHTPGACYTDVPAELMHLAGNPTTLHAAIKIAGMLSNNLILISRKLTEDWTPKRYLIMHWQRKFPLYNLRDVGSIEHLRIWPNEMPYSPGHGLSLCGDGLIEGLEQYGSIAYEWNVPVDVRAEMDNSTRDIEKMFREMSLLCPPLNKKILPYEAYLLLFQNTMAFSTQSTQHLHIARGTVETFPIYILPATSSVYYDKIAATIEVVQVGSDIDAMYLRIYFKDLDNDNLLQFLLTLNVALIKHFPPPNSVDTYIHITVDLHGRYVFIFEPHVLLQETVDRKFLNPETGSVNIRKPQYLIPEAERLYEFEEEHHLHHGRKFLSKFFDATCKRGIHDFLQQYIKANL